MVFNRICRTCHGRINWNQLKYIAIESDYRKRKTQEILEIYKAKYDINITVLNSDGVDLVKSYIWTQ